MPKNIFRKYFPKQETVLSNKYLQKFKHWLDDPNLWHMNRHSVSWGFACGLFMAFIPFPMQMVFASLLAIVFRANIPIAFSLVWITNPITIPPMFYFAYQVGAWLLDTPVSSFEIEFSLRWLFEELGSRWRPFLLGCLVSGFIAAIIGYLSVQLFWRYHIVQKLLKKRRDFARKILPKK